jgi:transglutaminase-like putative cysteine protease
VRYKIIHKSIYKFDNQVFIEPHYLRFKPQTSPNIQLEYFDIQIQPNPAGLSEIIDTEGNIIHLSWFDGLHNSLTVKTESILKISTYNPFNFIVYPNQFNKLPFQYSDIQDAILIPALNALPIAKSLVEYGETVQRSSNYDTVEFLTTLTNKIHADFSLIYRHEGSPFHPDKTFEIKQGSCRDIAWMQIQLLRHLGIASRFVSGYYYVPLEKPDYELHAWLEVFIPSAGWIGFDPSHGIIVGNNHIPLASSSYSENTMPITGSIRGNASSKLTTTLVIDPLH